MKISIFLKKDADKIRYQFGTTGGLGCEIILGLLILSMSVNGMLRSKIFSMRGLEQRGPLSPSPPLVVDVLSRLV